VRADSRGKQVIIVTEQKRSFWPDIMGIANLIRNLGKLAIDYLGNRPVRGGHGVVDFQVHELRAVVAAMAAAAGS